MGDTTPPPVSPAPSPSGVTNATPADPGNPYNINTGTPVPGQLQDPNTITVTVNGRQYQLTIIKQLSHDTPISTRTLLADRTKGLKGGYEDAPSGSIADKLAEIQDWYGNTTKRAQIVQQMYAAGLVSSKKSPSAAEVINAWSLLVQEAALENQVGGKATTPEDLLAKAAKVGWNSVSAQLTPDSTGVQGTGNLNNAADASTTTQQTIYKSYLDPATVMGAQADAWFRLLGRNPTQQEYQSFLNSIMSYQDAENTGKFEAQTKDPADKLSGDYNPAQGISAAQFDPQTQTTTVSQRGIGTRGLQFLAGQAALSNPQEGAYQAATTYFNAFIKALSGPASGMQASGPTTTVP